MFKAKLDSSNPKKRIKAVKNTKDIVPLVQMLQKETEQQVLQALNERIQSLLPDVALNHENPQLRKAAVADINDQAVLEKAVLNDSDLGVRIATLPKLQNQNIITKIVENEENHWVLRTEALKYTNDTALLEKYALYDAHADIQLSAISNPLLKDQSIIKQVAENTSFFWKCRQKAVSKSDDQKSIEAIACNAPWIFDPQEQEELYLTAVHKLTSAKALKNVVIHCANYDIAEQALDNLLKHKPAAEMLTHIAKNAATENVKKQAFEELKNMKADTSDLAKKIAINKNANIDSRIEAIKSITDADFINKHILGRQHDENDELDEQDRNMIKVYSILRLHNLQKASPKQLKEMLSIEDVMFSDMGREIVSEIKDEKVLAELLKRKNKTPLFVWGDQEYSSGADYIMQMRRDNPVIDVAEEALKQIKDKAILKDILQNAAYEHVRIHITELTEDPELLEIAAKNDESWLVRYDATFKIKDRKLLEEIANTDENDNVRELAKRMMSKIN
jgi:hypothetical protein